MPQGLPDQGNGTRVISGARAIFIFNGDIIGFASGVNGSEEIQYEPIDVLDDLAVKEHVPVGYRVSFSASIFRTVGAGGVSTQDKPGSLKEQQIFPRFDQIMRLDGVECLIQDTLTGKTLFMLRNVKTASYNFSITARGVVGQNVTFVATRAFDESEVR
jgi:hypothetical protein